MSNKEFILEEILSFEAISRISKMLDQFVESLNSLGLFKIMWLLPKNFVHIFTYRAVSTSDVLNLLHVLENLWHYFITFAKVYYRFFRRKVTISTCLICSSYSVHSVLRKFLLYITGSVFPSPIKISFLMKMNVVLYLHIHVGRK